MNLFGGIFCFFRISRNYTVDSKFEPRSETLVKKVVFFAQMFAGFFHGSPDCFAQLTTLKSERSWCMVNTIGDQRKDLDRTKYIIRLVETGDKPSATCLLCYLVCSRGVVGVVRSGSMLFRVCRETWCRVSVITDCWSPHFRTIWLASMFSDESRNSETFRKVCLVYAMYIKSFVAATLILFPFTVHTLPFGET